MKMGSMKYRIKKSFPSTRLQSYTVTLKSTALLKRKRKSRNPNILFRAYEDTKKSVTL